MLLLTVSALATPLDLGAHARHDLELGAGALSAFPPPRRMLPGPTPGPTMRVYGYLAYWDDDLATVPWDELSDIAIFSVGVNANGTLGATTNWDIADDAVAMAAPYGVKVHLCVTQFDPGTIESILASSTNRATLIDELVDWQGRTGADGVNVDFEGLPYAVKDEMVAFTRDLAAAVGEVVLATPAVDWEGSWDYSELTASADLFIMGYDYHWSGSSYAGPSDPLNAGSGTVWSGVNSYSITWTVDDYLYWGGDPDHIILGLPLYGRSWPTSGNGVPEPTLATGSTALFADAWDKAATYGRSWEPDSSSAYTYGGGEQTWYGDEESVRERIVFARDDAGLAGVGFWALHYDGDDASFWSMIAAETGSEGPGTTTGGTTTGGTTTGGTTTGGTTGGTEWVADAGLPFLAYVGDTVVLSGEGSRGPAGASVTYRWTQVAGAPVDLSDAASATPAFAVGSPGTREFTLEVGDGTTWSTPASSWVVVIDPGLAGDRKGCGCAPGPGPAGLALALVPLALVRRRSR